MHTLLALSDGPDAFTIGYLILSIVPLFALGIALAWRRKKFAKESRSPFSDAPLRPAGESLRLKIEDMSDELTMLLLSILLAGLCSTIAVQFYPLSVRVGMGAVTFLLVLAYQGCQGFRLWKLQKELRDHRLGFEGERVVGEILNQLVSDGYQVFHDLPFDGFNIDHVIVGPTGVYSVETKTRRKPADIKGTPKVFFDGQQLKFPWGTDRFGLEQAERNAATLSKWLSKATGEKTEVEPILTLPGWWVERTANGSVKVLNPKQIRQSFPRRSNPALTPDRLERIRHQLSEKCRMDVS